MTSRRGTPLEAAHLVDALGDFEQAVDCVELGLALQTRVDAVGSLAARHEGVGLHEIFSTTTTASITCLSSNG